MFKVQCVQSIKNIKTDLYSKYYIGPFVNGQSLTIGNSLRRILLSTLEGLAIVGVRISGIDHEFTTIPYVREDVIDILLNLKQIVLTGNIKEPTLARLRLKRKGIITADDIEFPSDVKLIDSHQYIAHVSENNNLEMEFLIAKGQDYITSPNLNSILPTGFLSVDAVFMPIKKVNFFIEPGQKNQSSELETLIFEIWTNGSITPSQALSISAANLEQIFKQLKITNTAPTSHFEENISYKKENVSTIFIEELELSVRAYNCLKRENINTISELKKYSLTDLLRLKNFGKKSLEEVFQSLKNKFSIELAK